MVSPDQLSYHLQTITRADWQRLYLCLAELNEVTAFGKFHFPELVDVDVYTMPHWSMSEAVRKFVALCYELELVATFDWMNWSEGSEMLDTDETDFQTCDLATLCKLLTVGIRGDRFHDGYLVSLFERGVITKILEAIQLKTIDLS